MKKFISFFAIIAFFAAITSCQKSDDPIGQKKEYVEAMKGNFSIGASDDNVRLKSTAVPTTFSHEFNIFKPAATGSAQNFELVNGNNFFPGSDAQMYWANKPNPQVVAAGGAYDFKYCPLTPIRIVVKTFANGGTQITHIGIKDIASPAVSMFPTNVVCKSTRDVLSVDYSDIIRAFGGSQTNFQIKVSYTKSPIDFNKTFQSKNLQWETTGLSEGWLKNYEYSQSVDVKDASAYSSDGRGVLLFDSFDTKVTGTISISIVVGSQTITKTAVPFAPGQGTKLVLKTDKEGYIFIPDPNGKITVTDQDITVSEVVVNF